MKKTIAILLAVLFVFSALTLVACKTTDDKDPETTTDPTVTTDKADDTTTEADDTTADVAVEAAKVVKTYVAAYSNADAKEQGAVLVSLLDNGKAIANVGTVKDGANKTAEVEGTYTLGTNAENDETLTVAIEGVLSTDKLAVVDGKFTTACKFDEASVDDVNFYELPAIETAGKTYVGFLAKVSGMGAMVYAYVINLCDENKFEASILQATPFGAAEDSVSGTYAADKTAGTISFTYDVCEEGTVVEGGKDYTANGSDYNEITFKVGLNVGQVMMPASAADFVLVK